MKSATFNLKAFGLYMMVLPGLGLMTFPGLLLDLFRLSHGDLLWTARVVGLLAFIIGTYQFAIGMLRVQALYRVTVWQRYFAAFFFGGLYVTGAAEISILLFALIDIVGATWTLLATPRNDSINVRAAAAR